MAASPPRLPHSTVSIHTTLGNAMVILRPLASVTPTYTLTHLVGGSLHAVSCHSTCYKTSHKCAPSSPGSSYTSSRDRTYLLVSTSAAQDGLVARASISKHVQLTTHRLGVCPTPPPQFPSIPIPFFWPSAPCPFQLPELSTGAHWLAPNQILVEVQIC